MVNMTPTPRTDAFEWDRHAVLAELRRRGTSLMQVGRSAGFARETLYRALDRRFPRAHSAIATAMGLKRHDIWPHWYDESDRVLPLQDVRRGAIRAARRAA